MSTMSRLERRSTVAVAVFTASFRKAAPKSEPHRLQKARGHSGAMFGQRRHPSRHMSKKNLAGMFSPSGPRTPLTEETAALIIQRSFRGMISRKKFNASSRHSAITGLARQMASNVGSIVGQIVDNVLLAPVNMASENLIHAALGKLLSVLVKGYDKRKTLKMTSAGIVIGGKEGLHLDDEALAALLGGVSIYTNVWLSAITIKLPVVLTVWPVEVSVAKVTFTMPAVPLVLTPERLAYLDKAMNGDKPKGPVKKAHSQVQTVADLDARIAAAKYGVEPGSSAAGGGSARSLQRGALSAGGGMGDEADDEGGEGAYGQFERAIDGVVVVIGLLELTMPKMDAIEPTEPTAAEVTAQPAAAAASVQAAHKTALRRAAERIQPDVKLVSLGCFVCGVRKPSSQGRGPLSWLARKNEQARGHGLTGGVGAGHLAPLPADATILRFDNLRLTNCTADFVQTDRLVTVTRTAGGERGVLSAVGGAVSGAFGAIGSGFSSLFGGHAHAVSSSTARAGGGVPRAPSAELSAAQADGAEVHVYKRLATDTFSATVTNAHGMHVPMLQGIELAIHIQMVRAKRTGKLLKLEVDLIFPDSPVGWLVDAAARTHGHLHIKTARFPANPRRANGIGKAGAAGAHALNPFGALFGFGAPRPDAAELESDGESVLASELANWRRGADRALNIAASFDVLDSHIRACLERRLSEPTLRELVRAREKAGLGRTPGETAGELLWTSPEHTARAQLPSATFRALLSKHEVMLSDETFKILLGKLDAHLSDTVDLHRFLATYMPDKAAAEAAARTTGVGRQPSRA